MGLARSRSKVRGREVSCVLVAPLIETLLSQGVDPESVARATGLTTVFLRDRRQRVSWEVFTRLISTLSQTQDAGAFSDAGASLVRLLGRAPAPALSRRIVGPADLYALFGHAFGWRERRLVSCVDRRAWEVSPTNIVVQLTIEDGYEPCDALYFLAQGVLRAIPTLLDLPAASVEIEVVDRGALFHVTLPAHGSLVARGRRFVRYLRTVRVAVGEL